MHGNPGAASPTMPGNGRAYLLVGTGSKFMYFQSAYTGANKDENIEPVVSATQVFPCGNHNSDFYISTKHNARIRKLSKNVKAHDTQLFYIVKLIERFKAQNENSRYYREPRMIFKRPLKSKIPDQTHWR